MSRGGCSFAPEAPQRGRKHIYQDCCSEASPALSPHQLHHTAQGSRGAAGVPARSPGRAKMMLSGRGMGGRQKAWAVPRAPLLTTWREQY